MMENELKRPAFDPLTVEARIGTNYPKAYKGAVEGRKKRKIGDAAGLTRIGVNLVTLRPGGASAHRHWHTHEDEFIYILEGEATLVTDIGEQKLGPGMVAGFPAGVPDGHQLLNKTEAPVVYLEIGDRNPEDGAEYPDVDLRVRRVEGGYQFTRKDGTPL